MDWKKFWIAYAVMQGLVIAQVIAAWYDGRLYQGQMKRCGYNGYSLMEHGGFRFDMALLSLYVAGIVGKYSLEGYWYLILVILLLAVLAVELVLGMIYTEAGSKIHEAYTHGGETTWAGRIHGAYAWMAGGTFVAFYLLPLHPQAQKADVYVISVLLTLLCPIGAIKFNKLWRFDTMAKRQTFLGPIAIWTVALVKIFFFM